jgi:hypothetical protein
MLKEKWKVVKINKPSIVSTLVRSALGLPPLRVLLTVVSSRGRIQKVWSKEQ